MKFLVSRETVVLLEQGLSKIQKCVITIKD